MKEKKELSRIIYDHYQTIWKICGIVTVAIVLLNIFVFNVSNLTAMTFVVYMTIIIPLGTIAKKVDNKEKQKLILKIDKHYNC